jgi:hypothetical protein
MRRVLLAMSVAGVLVVAACSDDGSSEDEHAVAAPTTSTVATPTTEATTTSSDPVTTEATTTSTEAVTTTRPPQGGEAGPGCVSGWIAPTRGTALRVKPLDVIRTQMGITGEFQVIEMRYFTGPEVPWILQPRPPLVQRWYVKAQLVDDPAFRARWLVEKRSPAIEGIAAVTSFNTAGYQSPDWRGFLGEGEPRAVEGLPGTWVGFNFDYLTGEDGEKPGLPNEVVHCLDGT